MACHHGSLGGRAETGDGSTQRISGRWQVPWCARTARNRRVRDAVVPVDVTYLIRCCGVWFSDKVLEATDALPAMPTLLSLSSILFRSLSAVVECPDPGSDGRCRAIPRNHAGVPDARSGSVCQLGLSVGWVGGWTPRGWTTAGWPGRLVSGHGAHMTTWAAQGWQVGMRTIPGDVSGIGAGISPWRVRCLGARPEEPAENQDVQ